MSVSIRGCPACNAMLLGDSAQCPHCGHVLDASRVGSDFLDLIPASELKMSSDNEDEQPCRQCGEMVRVGLVRCWHCGAFTNPEIEATYQRMQANPPPIMFSDVSGDDANSPSAPSEQFRHQFTSHDDGGFELQDSYFEGSEDADFSVAPDVAAIPAAAVPATAAPVATTTPAASTQTHYTYQQAMNQQAASSSAVAPSAAEAASADAGQATVTQPEVDQPAYDQAGYGQYQQQYYDPNAQRGEPGFYDPNAQPGEEGYFDPNGSYNYDPNVTYDPDTGLAYDATTGITYDPNTGIAYDPATGQAYDPNTGAPYDPNSGYGYESHAAYDPNADQNQQADDSGTEIPQQSEYAVQQPEAAPEAAAGIPELPGTAADAPPAVPTPATSAATSAEMPPPPDVAHSISTGGEALLQAAMEEEKQSVQLRKMWGRKRASGQGLPPGAFLIFCPNGHKVQVHDRHRGRAGRCPNCKAVFFVPVAAAETPTTEVQGQAGPGATDGRYQVGNFTDWIFDIRLHTVNPSKLKLKPGAMAGEFDVADVAFSETELLVATVFKRGGTFAAMQEKKKKPATRLAIADILQTKKPPAGLPVPFQSLMTADDANQLKIVQPAAPGEESIFAGIPVFGPGRIVVRLPAQLDGGSRAYLSFSLSEFREFARLLEARLGIVAFGQELGIPLTDITSTYKCHYSDLELVAIENIEFYQHDPSLKPVVIGRKCAGCGLVVSEDARKKEKIGGKTDASIAKAVCPKCKKKFGEITFYGADPKAKPVVFGVLPLEGK